MDPLSLVANVLAVIGAANAVGQRLEKLRSFKGAPDQLLQVINEVSDIRTIFTAAQQTCMVLEVDNDQDASLCTKLRELLVEAERNFEFFDRLAQKLLPDAQHPGAGPSKVSWRLWMRERKDVQKYSAALRDINRKIMDVLAILQVSNIPKVHVRMADIISRQNETHQNLSSVQSNMEELQLVTNQALSVQPQLNALQQDLEALQAVSTNSELGRRSNVPSSQDSDPVIRVQSSVSRPQTCQKFCMCRCHKKRALSSPSWMQHLIGALFIGYTAVPIPNLATCNENMCMQYQNQPLITVNYYFPSWLLRRAVLLRSRWSPMDGCMISVRTPRMVSMSSTQILLCQIGNVVGMQRLFSQGLASPFDIEERLGNSCLGFAVQYGHAEMAKFLLSQHADPYHLNKSSMSCLSYIWRYLMEEKLLSPAQVIIQDLFKEFLEDYEDLAKELGLTVLHQIVLGMVDIDLKTQLSVTTIEINTLCSNNFTPLMWATRMSDLKAMQLLIDFGASLDTTGHGGRNVFHMAARKGSLEALKLLLDNFMATPMPSNIEYKEPGTPLFDHEDVTGGTPLLIAIIHKRTSHALLLLQFQCAINPSPSSQSPFLASVQFNEYEVLRYLLTKGVKMGVVDDDKMGVLHTAGGAGDLETILILLHHETPLSISAIHVDRYGNTPMRGFEIYRQGLVHEDAEQLAKSREAFEALLNKANSYQLQL